MLFHFSKRQRRIDTFAQLQRNPGGYVKICLLEPKTFPDGRSKKMIFSWLRDPRFEIDRGPGRADTEMTLNSSLLSTGSTNEFSAASWRRVENREFYKEYHSETLGASWCSPPRRNRRCWTLTVAQQRQPPPPRLFVTIVPYVRWNQSIPAVSADRIPISRHSAATRTFYTSFKRAPLVGLVRNV